jgi:hypothetical protein
MSAQFTMLSKDYIKRWMRGLIVPGGRGLREGPTINKVARWMGIPRNSLVWLAYRPDTARISLAMQRRYSKAIAMIENGQVEFVSGSGARASRAVLVDKPRPRGKYAVTLGKRGPALVHAERPAPFKPMPAFKDVMLK